MLIIITNTIKPYCYDIEPVIGLPNNLSHRFRYRSRWIKLPYSIESTKLREGIVVLRDYSSAELIPIRRVIIEDVLSFGDIHYIELRLNEFIPNSLEVGLAALIQAKIVEFGYKNLSNNHLEKLIFEVDFKYDSPEKDLGGGEKWALLTKRLGSLECYKDFSFLKILSINDSKGSPANIVRGAIGRYCYSLKPNNLYFANVIQSITSNIEEDESIENPYDIELKAESDEIWVLRGIQRVVGKYDLLRFIIKTPISKKNKYTFLELQKKQPIGGLTYELPALFLPVNILVPTIKKIIMWMRGSISVLSLASLICSGIIAKQFNWDVNIFRTFATVVLVLAIGKYDEFAGAFIKETKNARLD